MQRLIQSQCRQAPATRKGGGPTHAVTIGEPAAWGRAHARRLRRPVDQEDFA